MKKLAASLAICSMLIASPVMAFADNVSKSGSNSIEIIKPDSDYTITTNNKIVVSGKGKAGCTVDIEVYTKKDGKFAPTKQKKTIEIGPIGLFVSEVNLIEEGENKIVFNYGDSSESKIVRYVSTGDAKKDILTLKDKGITEIIKPTIPK